MGAVGAAGVGSVATGRPKVQVVPILVSPALLTGSPLRELQAVPRSGRPLSTLDASRREAAWVEVVQSIHTLIEARPTSLASPAAAEPAHPPVPVRTSVRFLQASTGPSILPRE